MTVVLTHSRLARGTRLSLERQMAALVTLLGSALALAGRQVKQCPDPSRCLPQQTFLCADSSKAALVGAFVSTHTPVSFSMVARRTYCRCPAPWLVSLRYETEVATRLPPSAVWNPIYVCKIYRMYHMTTGQPATAPHEHLPEPDANTISKVLVAKYELLAKVGEGTCGASGAIYRARRKNGNKFVAIKEIKTSPEMGVQTSSLRETSLLLDLQHPNVIKLHEVLSDKLPRKVYMVLEFLDLDLHQLMRKAPHLLPSNPRLVKFYFWQLLQGLAYCHSRRVIHRDIKPQNLRIDVAKNSIKLTHFGHARTLGLPIRCLSPQVVTIWYRPPEVLLSSRGYSAAVDMWSMGCVFYELATSKTLFAGTREIDQVFRIFSVLGLPTEATWPGVSELTGCTSLAAMTDQCKHPQGLEGVAGNSFNAEGLDLLRCLLQPCPDKRITAKAALRHSYFDDIQSVLDNPPQLSHVDIDGSSGVSAS